MKKFNNLLTLVLIFCYLNTYAQTGPAGVGNSGGTSDQPKNILWLDANSLSGTVTDGNDVSTWTDISGNGIVFSASTSGNLPDFETGEVNGLPVVEFNDSNSERLVVNPFNSMPSDNISTIIVFATANTGEGILSYAVGSNTNEYLFFDAGDIRTYVNDGFTGGGDLQDGSGTFNIFSSRWTSSGGTLSHTKNGTSVFSGTLSNGTGMVNGGSMAIGGEQDAIDGGYDTSQDFNGKIAEIIVYEKFLNDAERTILENYLSVKYGITISNDYYSSHDAAYTQDLIGIGTVDGTDKHSSSAGSSGGLSISENDNSLNQANEFVFVAHNGIAHNAGIATELGETEITSRWQRDYYIEQSRDGTVDGASVEVNLTFDFDEAFGTPTDPGDASQYVLLYRATTGDSFTRVYSTVSKVDNTIVCGLPSVLLKSGYYTLGMGDQIETQTWYSFKTGTWNDATSWTLDGSVAPLYVNPSNEVPDDFDNVIITNGRTITLDVDNISVAGIEVIGTLDLATTQGHDLSEINGRGKIRMQGWDDDSNAATMAVDNFPDGIVTGTNGFADISNGGTLELYGDGIKLNQARTFKNVLVDMTTSSDEAIVLSDYVMNGDLTLVNGVFKINDDTDTTSLNIDLFGDYLITSNGSQRVGTADARHEFNFYGDVTNYGDTRFSQRTTQVTGSEATDGIVDANFLRDDLDQTILCNNVTYFYRIVCDKGSDDTYILDIQSISSGNFVLTGSTNYNINTDITDEGSNLNALSLVKGTVKINENVTINPLNTSTNYSIPSASKLLVAGGTLIKDQANAIVPYGTIQITSGYLEATGASGLTLRRNGRIQIDGGTVLTNQIRTSVEGAESIGGYVQTGGTVTVNGDLGNTQTTYAIFCLTYEDNVFIMTGGTLNIQGATALSDQTANNSAAYHGGLIFINSDAGNINVSAGTVNVTTTADREHIITSRAPFYDLNITNTSSGTSAKVVLSGSTSGDTGLGDNGTNEGGTGDDEWRTLAAQTLTVLNNLTLNTGTTRTSGSNTYGTYLDFCSSGTCANLEVGGNLTIEDSGVLDIWNDADNTASSSVTINGTSDANFYLGDITTYSEDLTGYSPAATEQEGYERWELPFHNLTVDKPGATLTFSTKDPTFDGSPDGNDATTYKAGGGGKNVSTFGSNIWLITGSFTLTENSTIDQIDSNDSDVAYSVRLVGSDITNFGTFFTYTEGVTPVQGLVKFRKDGGDITVNTIATSEFGNVRINSGSNIISITSDVSMKRVQYRHGRIYIGTHNLKIDRLVHSLVTDDVRTDPDGDDDYSIEDMIIMDGNASDGGLSLYVNSLDNPGIAGHGTSDSEAVAINSFLDSRVYQFPIGTGKTGAYPASRYTPANIQLNAYNGDDGYITVNVVSQQLPTAGPHPLGNDVLQRYWRVRMEGFDTAPPTVRRHRFHATIADIPDGTNDTEMIITTGTWNPGFVLDGGAYARTAEENSANPNASSGFDTRNADVDDNVDDTNNEVVRIMFWGEVDGSGTGATPFTLVEANYTAGDPNKFVGAPQIFYSINTVANTEWNTPSAWSLSRDGTAAGDYPQAGDIAVLTRDDGDPSTDPTSYGPGVLLINNNTGPITIAELVFEDIDPVNNNNIGGTPRLTFSNDGSFAAYNSIIGKISISDDHIGSQFIEYLLDENYTQIFPNGDFGEFNNDNSSMVLYEWEGSGSGTAVLSADATEYPRLWIAEPGGNLTDRIIQFPDVDVTVNGSAFIGGSNLVRPNNSASSRTITFKQNLTLGSGCCQTGYLQFDGNSGADQTIIVEGNITYNSTNPGRIQLVNNTGSNTHKIIAKGNISIVGAGIFDLGNGTNSSIELEFQGESSNTFLSTATTTPQLYKVIMNKGSNQSNTFSFNSTFNIPDATSTFQPVEIRNGLLILNSSYNNNSGILLANGSGFKLPNTDNLDASSGSGGLEIAAGTVNVQGDDTGIILDGLLRVSGGSLNMLDAVNNGNNFIEYSSSGNAKLEITSGQLSVGGQVRRATTSTTGVLQYAQTGGTAIFGRYAAPESSRGVFEVMNTGSSFTHTGGTMTLFQSNGSTTVPSLYLSPETYSISDESVINLGDEGTTLGQTMGVISDIPLNNLTVAQGSAGGDAIDLQVKLFGVALETDTLRIGGNDEVPTFDANGFDLTINEALINDNIFIASGNTTNAQSTSFPSSSNATISGHGTTTFWKFNKTGSGTLTLSEQDITVQEDIRLESGTFETGDFSVTVQGDVYNDATHSSSAPNAADPTDLRGIVMAGDGRQKLERSSVGTSYFGTLTIDNPNNVIVEDETFYTFQVDQALVLSQGVLDISSNLFVIGADATIQNGIGNSGRDDFNASNMVQTNSAFQDFGLRKVFTDDTQSNFVYPIGQQVYTPLVLEMTANIQTTAATGSLTVRPSSEAHPTVNDHDNTGALTPGTISDINNVLQYHWILKAEDIQSFTGNLDMTYDQSDVAVLDAGDAIASVSFTEANYAAARLLFSSNSWDKVYDGTSVDESSNRIFFYALDFAAGQGLNGGGDTQITGDYTAGLLVEDDGTTLLDVGAFPNTVPEYESVGAIGEFDDYVDWNGINGTDDLASGEIPTGAILYIRNGDNMTFDIANARMYRTVIEEGATLEVTENASNTRLGIVEGTGTLKLTMNTPNSSFQLPAGYYEDFLDCSGGKLEFDGSVDYEVLAGVPEIRAVTFSGSGNRELSNSDIKVCEDLNFNDNVGFENTFARDITVLGNIIKTDNSTTDWLSYPVSGRESTLILSGSTEQSVTGDFSGSNAIHQLTVNNNAGITVVNAAQTGIAAGGDVEISDQLTLTNGLVQTDTDNSLRIQADATISGGGEFNHINGPLVREMRNGSNDYFFPVGSQGRYGRIDLENPAGFTGTKDWTATYFWELNPYDLFTMTANATTEGVEKASTFEYWNLDAASPANSNVRPYWDSNSDVTNPSDLRVIFWDNTAWEVLPEVSAPSGSSASGNLSAGPLSFSTKTVTFGSINQTITLLPVELLYFRGESRSKGNLLIWATASETENAFFEVLRSKNGKNFEPIGRIGAKGDPNNRAEYNFMDKSPYPGTSYYLLKQVDKDGNFSNSEVIAIKYERFGNEDVTLSAYPNPVTSEEFELLGENWLSNSTLHYKIMNVTGNLLRMGQLEIDSNGTIQNQLRLPKNLTMGVYILFASDGIHKKSIKVKVD